MFVKRVWLCVCLLEYKASILVFPQKYKMLEANWKIECWVWNVQFSSRQSRGPPPSPAWPQSTYICKYVMVKISASHGCIAGRGWVLEVTCFVPWCHGAIVGCDHWPRDAASQECGEQNMYNQTVTAFRRAEIVRELKPHEHQECLCQQHTTPTFNLSRAF